jgi:hypothetical protein
MRAGFELPTLAHLSEQPVSPSLAVLLERRATSCSATAPGDAVFRTARGAPLSPRRYSTIFGRAPTMSRLGRPHPVSHADRADDVHPPEVTVPEAGIGDRGREDAERGGGQVAVARP